MEEKKKKKKTDKRSASTFAGLAGMFRKRDGKERIPIYEDFDTDEGEDLDITPAWKKDALGLELRKIEPHDLEQKYPIPSKMKKIPLWYGQSRGQK